MLSISFNDRSSSSLHEKKNNTESSIQNFDFFILKFNCNKDKKQL